jgi:dienelactone hydrolase
MKLIYYLLIALIFLLVGWLGNDFYRLRINNQSPSSISAIKARPHERYTIENLSKALIPEVPITIEEELSKNEDFTSYLISFTFDPTLSGKKEKKVTGLMNVPLNGTSFPLVLMFRGYVDQNLYETGMGSKRAGEYFAENGYITIAPDFLGYAGSDQESENIFESRFQTYTTALTLGSSIKNIDKWDGENIFIWGHSNGGQVALTFLEITKGTYPTVLWAPVSKPFPYSILYYTDESEDGGKFIRRELAKFEEDYNVDSYSITNYLDRITAPIQVHQGTADDAIPVEWTNNLVDRLEDIEVNVDYMTHPGADHNLNPSWSTAVAQSLDFFNDYLAK